MPMWMMTAVLGKLLFSIDSWKFRGLHEDDDVVLLGDDVEQKVDQIEVDHGHELEVVDVHGRLLPLIGFAHCPHPRPKTCQTQSIRNALEQGGGYAVLLAAAL